MVDFSKLWLWVIFKVFCFLRKIYSAFLCFIHILFPTLRYRYNKNFITYYCCCCLVAKSCLTLCDPVSSSPPVSSVHGIFQARILEWDCYFLHQGIFLIEPHLLCWAGGFFTAESAGKPFIAYRIV